MVRKAPDLLPRPADALEHVGLDGVDLFSVQKVTVRISSNGAGSFR